MTRHGVALAIILNIAMAPMALAQTDGWWQQLQQKQDHVTGNLGTRFTLDDLESGAGGGGADGSGADGGIAESGADGTGGDGGATAGGPGPTTPAGAIDPGNREIAILIVTWLRAAEPPENATEGASLRYSNAAVKIGTTADGGIITARHDPPVPDPVWLWNNRRQLDSIDHCTMEEYVTRSVNGESIALCRGRYNRIGGQIGQSTQPGGQDVASALPPDSNTLAPGTQLQTPLPLPQAAEPSTPELPPAGAPGGSIGGTWDTSFGTMVLPDSIAGGVFGPYSEDNGRVIGDLRGSSLTGVWVEDGSDNECSTSRDGSTAWGRIDFTFDAERRVFSGRWGYCDGELSRDWEGTRVSDKGILDLEPGIDRPGGDYDNFALAESDPAICRARCASEDGCLAWTFVQPGIQGSEARCWLKSAVPDPVEHSCCVSGVMAERPAQVADLPAPQPQPAPPPQPAPAEPPSVASGDDYFIGVWALVKNACFGRPPPVTPDDDDWLGIGAAMEEVFGRMGFILDAGGAFTLRDMVSGSTESTGNWSANDNALSLSSSSFDTIAFQVRDRHGDRFIAADPNSGDSVTFWRCR